MAGQRQLGQCHCPQRAGAPFDLCPFAHLDVVDGVPAGWVKFSDREWWEIGWIPNPVPVLWMISQVGYPLVNSHNYGTSHVFKAKRSVNGNL